MSKDRAKLYIPESKSTREIVKISLLRDSQCVLCVRIFLDPPTEILTQQQEVVMGDVVGIEVVKYNTSKALSLYHGAKFFTLFNLHNTPIG